MVSAAEVSRSGCVASFGSVSDIEGLPGGITLHPQGTEAFFCSELREFGRSVLSFSPCPAPVNVSTSERKHRTPELPNPRTEERRGILTASPGGHDDAR